MPKIRDALVDCSVFIRNLEIQADEDSCMGMAFVTNRVSEDGYYIVLNKIEKALEQIENERDEKVLSSSS